MVLMCVQVDQKEVNLTPEMVDMLRKLLADLNITPMPEVHTLRCWYGIFSLQVDVKYRSTVIMSIQRFFVNCIK